VRREGRVTRIEVVTFVEAEPDVVFDLELDVDVHAASLAGSSETASTSSGRRVLERGDDVTFSAHHLGLWWTMTSRITAHERPGFFVDEQVDGPFARMRHEHLFVRVGPGRTLMHDRMDVALACGAAGSVVARVILAPYLRRLLRRRGRAVALLAAGPVPPGGRLAP
jgi:ligand-binding SRPBCC domain-containing protein